MSKKVIIYSSDSCIYCKEAKAYFKNKGIEFDEKNITKDMDARKELMKMGYMSVPIIKIDDKIIKGFNKEMINKIIK